MEHKTTRILITGDITLDHFFLVGERAYADSASNLEGSSFCTIKGGAGNILQFLKTFSNSILPALGFNKNLFTKLPTQNKSYATIAQFKGGNEREKPRWRVAGQFGFGKVQGKVPYTKAQPITTLKGIDLLMIDDAGMNFGSSINRDEVWPWIEGFTLDHTDNKNPQLVICKKSGDLQKGDLWKELLTASKQNKIDLITIVTVNDIRREQARISSKISWEQSALDLVSEIHKNVSLKSLLNSRILVVTLGSSGAVIIANKRDGTFEYRLVFDPLHLEQEWESKINGSVLAKTSCFTAAFTSVLDLSNPGNDYGVIDGVTKGLAAVRGFFDVGYTRTIHGISLPGTILKETTKQHLLDFSWAFIPTFDTKPGFVEQPWSILRGNYLNNSIRKAQGPGPMFELARRITTKGRHELENVPSVQFEKLFTVDRTEIESLRNLKMLIEKYRNQKNAKIPLSIAVFGQPGSGKSFSVKQISKGVLGDKVPVLEFNLSQFAGPGDLIGAFHQVRDEVLKGYVPIVFWDEFDSKKYEWLQYLLAPMQDGNFQEGQATHTIGKCIMVFAGGTSYIMESFGTFYGEEKEKKEEEFKLKKGPDFISRIHGFLNVLGPNPRLILNEETKQWEIDPGDLCYPVRRGLFIRQILDLKEREVLDIDWGLLNALMKVGKYKHGSRSLENLLKGMKVNSDGRKLLRSHLPANAILKLYLNDIEDFFTLLNEDQEYHSYVLDIAPAIHQVWTEKAKGKNPDYLKEFNMLPAFIRASNIDAAIRVPKVLGKGHLKIVPVEGNRVFTQEEYLAYLNDENHKMLERMSEEEHNLWMTFYKRNEWEYNKVRNDYLKHHRCLVDYHSEALSEADKDKDRDQVRAYWEIIHSVGFGIIYE